MELNYPEGWKLKGWISLFTLLEFEPIEQEVEVADFYFAVRVQWTQIQFQKVVHKSEYDPENPTGV